MKGALDANPWQEPPENVVRMGFAVMANYLKDLDDFGRTFSNRLKAVLVGLGNAGKTSLAARLEGRGPEHLPSMEERTIGVEIRDVTLGPGLGNNDSRRSTKADTTVSGLDMPKVLHGADQLAPVPGDENRRGGIELDIKLWDFAGQRAYYDTHQIFLTPDALFILVVDMFAYSTVNSREDALDQWLHILQCRVPGSVVLIVGTHGDSFASPDQCSARVEHLQKDLSGTKERIRGNCRQVNGFRREGTGREEVKPIRIVEEVLVFNLTSRNEEMDKLRGLVERVAYGVHDRYRFPSVRTDVPKTHALAVSTLEAIRRGVDLTGLKGDLSEVMRSLCLQDNSRRKQPFVTFANAFDAFVDLCKSQKSFFLRMLMNFEVSGWRVELEQAFLRAVRLYEAQGAILVTRGDGGGQERPRHGGGADVPTSNLIIHVNPAWLADLVRRIVDVRLMESLEQQRVWNELKEYPVVSGMRTVSRQHNRFFRAGEVSRDYLEFLWLRDMKLGPASIEAPPLEMTKEDVSVVVDSLLDVRFMFRVRDEKGAVIPQLFVVASCLPDHPGCDMEPKDLLDLDIGGAMFSQDLDVVGAHILPPGLIPRLIAWCGRGEGRIKACWKRGVCFGFRKHLVLVCGQQLSQGQASISCHAMGSAHDERGAHPLEEVVRELDSLISDKVYGFPGVGLLCKGQPLKTSARSVHELEALLARVECQLKDHMNVKFEELERKAGSIAGSVQQHLQKGQEKIAESFNCRIEEVGQELSLKLGCIEAVTSKCLMVSVEKDVPCPRLIMVSEDASPGSTPSRVAHFRQEAMNKLRPRTTAQPKPTRHRVRFLCAYDLSAATCGEDGNGYKVEAKQWKKWLQRFLPLIQVSLWLIKVGLSAITRADVLPIDAVMASLQELAGQEAAGLMGTIDLASLSASSGPEDLVGKIENQAEVFGKAYDDLATWVQEEEDKIAGRICNPLATARARQGESTAATAVAGEGGASGGPATIRSFELDMVLASRQRGVDEPEFAWVRRSNLDKWKDFQSPTPFPRRD